MKQPAKMTRAVKAALAELVTNAMDLANSMIALAPDRQVSDAELIRVEEQIVELILKESHLADGPIADHFRKLFHDRFRAQASLKLAPARGAA